MTGQLTQDRKTTADAPQHATEKKKLQQAAAVQGAFAHRNVHKTTELLATPTAAPNVRTDLLNPNILTSVAKQPSKTTLEGRTPIEELANRFCLEIIAG
jgi:hypothetical protein